MRLSEMLEKATEGDSSHLDEFVRRLMSGGRPTDEELSNAYDQYLFRRMVGLATQDFLADTLRQTAEEMPPIMRKQGAMALASLARKVTKERR